MGLCCGAGWNGSQPKLVRQPFTRLWSLRTPATSLGAVSAKPAVGGVAECAFIVVYFLRSSGGGVFLILV